MTIDVLTPDWPEHELLDCGDRRKLERFGSQILIREEPKAWWQPALASADWARAGAEHDARGRWRLRPACPREWTLRFERLTLQARLTDTSKHVGFFPEQAPHWRWILAESQRAPQQPKRLLNLFGYTGVASLVAAGAGFEVTHVDASQPALAWGKVHQRLSGLESAPIRWLLDDAVKFVKRELRRGRRYDAFLLDPPSFGRGPQHEVWKVEDRLPELLALCRQLASDTPRFMLVTLYNLDASALMLGNLLQDVWRDAPGSTWVGELALRQTAAPRLLPLSLFGRWTAAAERSATRDALLLQ